MPILIHNIGHLVISDVTNYHESYDLPETAYIELDDDEEYIEESETNNDVEDEEETENVEPSVTLDDLLQGVPV